MFDTSVIAGPSNLTQGIFLLKEGGISLGTNILVYSNKYCDLGLCDSYQPAWQGDYQSIVGNRRSYQYHSSIVQL